MNKRTDEAKRRRLLMLEDLFVGSTEFTSVSHLCKKYGVSTNFLSVLRKRKLIKRKNGKYIWTHPAEPSEELVKDLMRNENAYFSPTKSATKENIDSKPPENKVGLSLVISFASLGTKYGIPEKKLESFVKDALEIVK